MHTLDAAKDTTSSIGAMVGPTDLDNGCLLCSSCHDDVHHHGWDIIMGFDRHPWLIPPASIDPKRRPVPSYHRRTMRLDDTAA